MVSLAEAGIIAVTKKFLAFKMLGLSCHGTMQVSEVIASFPQLISY